MAQWLPLFPLNVVLFPHMPLPLHIFEPRYRQMIAECLEEGHSFGVVAIREGAETGPATPHDVGTLAKIIRIERLDDGRMNLLVSGASRFEIVKTATDRPYLRGQVRIIPEAGDDLEATGRLTEATAMAFRRYFEPGAGARRPAAAAPGAADGAGAAFVPDRGGAEPADPREADAPGPAADR